MQTCQLVYVWHLVCEAPCFTLHYFSCFSLKKKRKRKKRNKSHTRVSHSALTHSFDLLALSPDNAIYQMPLTGQEWRLRSYVECKCPSISRGCPLSSEEKTARSVMRLRVRTRQHRQTTVAVVNTFFLFFSSISLFACRWGDKTKSLRRMLSPWGPGPQDWVWTGWWV